MTFKPHNLNATKTTVTDYGGHCQTLLHVIINFKAYA